MAEWTNTKLFTKGSTNSPMYPSPWNCSPLSKSVGERRRRDSSTSPTASSLPSTNWGNGHSCTPAVVELGRGGGQGGRCGTAAVRVDGAERRRRLLKARRCVGTGEKIGTMQLRGGAREIFGATKEGGRARLARES
jgi:hypothetical protein